MGLLGSKNKTSDTTLIDRVKQAGEANIPSRVVPVSFTSRAYLFLAGSPIKAMLSCTTGLV